YRGTQIPGGRRFADHPVRVGLTERMLLGHETLRSRQPGRAQHAEKKELTAELQKVTRRERCVGHLLVVVQERAAADVLYLQLVRSGLSEHELDARYLSYAERFDHPGSSWTVLRQKQAPVRVVGLGRAPAKDAERVAAAGWNRHRLADARRLFRAARND